MSTLLDVVRAEREALLAPIADKLAALDEIERLAAGLNGNGAAAQAAALSGDNIYPRADGRRVCITCARANANRQYAQIRAAHA